MQRSTIKHPLHGWELNPHTGVFINKQPADAVEKQQHKETIAKHEETIATLHGRIEKLEKVLAHFVLPKPEKKD